MKEHIPGMAPSLPHKASQEQPKYIHGKTNTQQQFNTLLGQIYHHTNNVLLVAKSPDIFELNKIKALIQDYWTKNGYQK